VPQAVAKAALKKVPKAAAKKAKRR
jgi:hypothetical protein